MGMISYPAPPLTQLADEDLIIEFAAVLDPDLVKRHQGENGLRLWVEGEAGGAAASEALRRFRVLLGVVRAWKPDAGELVAEREAVLGHGAARDASGTQTIHLGAVRMPVRFPGDVEGFADQVQDALTRHGRLREALEINGKPNRDAADFFNIGELCAADLGRTSIAVNDVARQLGLLLDELKLFEWSANNRSGTDGGRHALQSRMGNPPIPGARLWTLDEMREFVAKVIRAWVGGHD